MRIYGVKAGRVVHLTLACAMAAGLTGCKTPQNVSMFQDATSEQIIKVAEASPIVARPGDKLMIVVKCKDAAVSALFNMPVYNNRIDDPTGDKFSGNNSNLTEVPMASQGLASYTVSPKGDIDFPVLGELKVGGMSRQEIQGYIKGELTGRDLVKDPTVVVEFVNTGISVLGEVKTPGRYEVNKDQLTITDALALAGDVSLQGSRENVKVLRRENGELHTYVVDLTKASSVMGSPAYYLRQDDIVYVEPNDFQKRNTTVNGNSALNVSFWISVASLLTTAVTTVGVFVNK